MHYTTINAPRGVKILEDIIDNSTSVLATVFTLPIFVRVMVVNLADIPRCDAFVLFWVHFFETFDCVYFQRSCNVTNLERVNLLQEQVAATLLDLRNMPDLNWIGAFLYVNDMILIARSPAQLQSMIDACQD